MFATFARLQAVERLCRGVYIVNKARGWRLRLPSISILVTIFACDNRGERPTQNQLLDRLARNHNMNTCRGALENLLRLEKKGLIDKRKEGRAFYWSCTMSGRSYCIDLERALRNVRYNK